MRVLFLLAFILSLASAFAESVGSCCICVADPNDAKSTTKECKKWLRQSSRKLNCSSTVLLPTKDGPEFPENLSCEEVHVFAAFHGISSYYKVPFKLVSEAAKLPGVKEITYDGSTCLVFNNTAQVLAEATKLASQFPTKHFSIKGNQNIGVVFSIPVISKPSERKISSSKMNLEISGGTITTTYGDCSAPEKSCGYAKSYKDTTTDPNSKLCMQGNDLVIQKCCPVKERNFGNWSSPGEECN